MQAGTLDVHFDEENLRDGVEGAARVHFVDIAQDAVADEQQVLKFLAIEGAQAVEHFLQALGIAPVRGLGNFVDGDELARRAGDELENSGVALVGGNEDFAARGHGVGRGLVVVTLLNLDAIGLALDDENGKALGGAIIGGLPDNDVRAWAAVAVLRALLLIHLIQRVAVVLDQGADEPLTDDFLRLGADIAPFLTQGNPQPVAFLVQRVRRGREWQAGLVGWFSGLGHLVVPVQSCFFSSSAPPARTHSSTSDTLNFHSRPTRCAGRLLRSIQR